MIGARIEGDLAAIIDRRIDQAAAAVTDGVAEAASRLKQELRDQVRSAGLGGKLAVTWQSKLYPNRGTSLGAAALVYTKAEDVMRAFEFGAVIRPGGGKRFLAIPTGFNKAGGWRKSRGRPLVSTQGMVKAKGMTFVRPGKNGTLVWFMKVTRAQEMRKGSVRNLAYVGGQRLVGSGRRKRTDAALEAGAVPMFILVPQVRLQKRLDVLKAAEDAVAALPSTIARNLQRQAR